MKVYEMSSSALSRLVSGMPENLRFWLIRPSAQRWTEADLRELFEGVLPCQALSIWKFQRVVTQGDKTLGNALSETAKKDVARWAPFARWPNLQQFAPASLKHQAGEMSFAYAVSHLERAQAIQFAQEIASLMNYPSGFADNGLLTFHFSSFSAADSLADSLFKFFRFLMDRRSKGYGSNDEWQEDLKRKEQALVDIALKVANTRATLAIPLINENVEVSLLAGGAENYVYGLRQNASGMVTETNDWEVGVFR